MLVKCICRNCAGHLEFEEENAGETIKCPLCGFETVLFLPGQEEARAEVASLTRKLQAQQRLIVGVAALVVMGTAFWAVYHWGVPFVAGLLPDNESRVLPIALTAALCVILLLLLVWLILPVVLLLQARRLIAVLEQIEEDIRSQQVSVAPSLSPSEVVVPETEPLN